jgi:hypothetical protein
MADREGGGGIAGISLGGIIVIVGIVLMFVWSILAGLIVVLVGLIAFGGLPAASGTEAVPSAAAHRSSEQHEFGVARERRHGVILRAFDSDGGVACVDFSSEHVGGCLV